MFVFLMDFVNSNYERRQMSYVAPSRLKSLTYLRERVVHWLMYSCFSLIYLNYDKWKWYFTNTYFHFVT